jgi:hypothetical protein
VSSNSPDILNICSTSNGVLCERKKIIKGPKLYRNGVPVVKNLTGTTFRSVPGPIHPCGEGRKGEGTIWDVMGGEHPSKIKFYDYSTDDKHV